jgi:hypothetical protein
MAHLLKTLAAHGLVLTLGVAASAAHAQSSPYYFGGGLGLTQVSNLYRQSDNTNSDTVTTATLLAGLDQGLGRGRIFGDASLQNNRYRRNSDLNNQSYTLKAGLDWATLERLSGTVSGSRTRALASYNVGNGVALITKKNIEDTSSFDAVVRLGLVTRYSLEASAGYRSRKFSAIEYSSLEYTQERASLGLYYQPSPALRLGVSPRLSNTVYPRYVFQNGSFQRSESRRTDLDLTGRWVPTAISTFDARISTGKSTLTSGVGRDFSGVTGRLSWNWQPSARWALNTAISRDTGLETSYFATGVGNLSSDQNRITTALQINGSYELSSKIALMAGASLAKTDRSNAFLTQRADGFDRDTAVNLSARYQYSRGIQFSCQINHQARGSSTPSYVYDANSVGCAGQLIIN